MRTITGIVVVWACCCLAGCATQPPAGADVNTGGWSWYDYKEVNSEPGDVGVSASWGSWNKKFVYVILTDSTTSATTEINAAGSFQVDLKTPKGPKAEMRIETSDGKTGCVVCGEQSYNLAQGSVFILLPRGEKFQVQQLRRDLSDVPAGVGSAYQLLRDDPEIRRFFAPVE